MHTWARLWSYRVALPDCQWGGMWARFSSWGGGSAHLFINSLIGSFLIHTPIHHPQQILRGPLGGAAAATCTGSCWAQGGQVCAQCAGVKVQGKGILGRKTVG